MTERVTLKGSCPKHRRYRPQDGRGAIRGGCRICEALLEAYTKLMEAREAARRFEEEVRLYESLLRKMR